MRSYNKIKKKGSLKLFQQQRCPDCGGNAFITDPELGEVTCNQCGLVLHEAMLDRTPEWRAFSLEEKRSRTRTGRPSSLRQFDKGLSTTFQPYRDPYGKILPMKERLKMMRLHKWHTRTRVQSSKDRNLSRAMHELRRLADTLNIPSYITESTAQLYRKILDHGLVRGRSINGLVAATLLLACRLTDVPWNLKEIANTSNRTRKEISRCYRLIHRELDLGIPVDDPLKYVTKIASKVGLRQQIQTLAVDLIHQAEQKKALVGKGPPGVAAAALYIASRMNGVTITQRELAEAASVTEVTVRNRYKGLDHVLNLGLRRTNVRRNRKTL